MRLQSSAVPINPLLAPNLTPFLPSPGNVAVLAVLRANASLLLPAFCFFTEVCRVEGRLRRCGEIQSAPIETIDGKAVRSYAGGSEWRNIAVKRRFWLYYILPNNGIGKYSVPLVLFCHVRGKILQCT